MGLRPISRREALRLGAGALATGLLTPPDALAATGPELFELRLGDAAATAATAGWRTTRIYRAPRRFDLVGLRWARGGHLDAQVRARRRGGAWTAWAPLHAAAAHAPDGAARLAGTEPAFVGTADEFQLRLRGAARRVRVRFVRALPAARAARALTSRAAQAPAGAPPIIPRAAWGAAAVPPRVAPEYGAVQLAFVHHTVTTNNYTPEQSAGIVLGIARYHRDSNGWNDIGYNFLVDKYGQIFEGRAGGVDAAVVGAQAQGYNAQSTGIGCLGDFGAIPQSEAGIEALARLIGWKLPLHAVPVQGQVTVTSAGGATNRYRSGTPVTFQRISGHRDGDATSCPGNVLYGQLPALRARAAAHAGPLSGVTLRLASARQIGLSPVALSGNVHFADGSSAAGATVSVEYAAAGSAWTPLGSATVAPDGSWAASVALPASGRLRAVFGGDATRPRLVSAAAGVKVIPTLTLTTDRRRAPAGTAVAVSGTIAPSPPRVQCVLERQVGRRWLPVQRKRVSVRGGRYATTVRPRLPGRHRVTVSAGGVTKSRLIRAVRT